jgi:hypothetical protein
MDRFSDLLISFGPIIVLLAVWIFYMTRLKSPQQQTIEYLKKNNELMEKYVQVTERIAASLERIERRQEG